MLPDPVRLLECALDDVELRRTVLVLAHDELRGLRRGIRWAVAAHPADVARAEPAAQPAYVPRLDHPSGRRSRRAYRELAAARPCVAGEGTARGQDELQTWQPVPLATAGHRSDAVAGPA